MPRDLFTGLIKIHVLHHAVKEPIFGLAMIRELERHGYKISPGTLYPMLKGMEADGLLVSEARKVEGRRRKYYRATTKGETALQQLRPKIEELAGEVVEDRSPGSIEDVGADKAS